MIDLLPCGCTMISEWEYPRMEHVTRRAADFFNDIGYPGRRLAVVCWIRDGVRSSSHGCAARGGDGA